MPSAYSNRTAMDGKSEYFAIGQGRGRWGIGVGFRYTDSCAPGDED